MFITAEDFTQYEWILTADDTQYDPRDGKNWESVHYYTSFRADCLLRLRPYSRRVKVS